LSTTITSSRCPQPPPSNDSSSAYVSDGPRPVTAEASSQTPSVALEPAVSYTGEHPAGVVAVTCLPSAIVYETRGRVYLALGTVYRDLGVGHWEHLAPASAEQRLGHGRRPQLRAKTLVRLGTGWKQWVLLSKVLRLSRFLARSFANSTGGWG
ncbi:hypothetical protein K438DRAFT_1931108, partial [Mycena galopus ATCC 62051]